MLALYIITAEYIYDKKARGDRYSPTEICLIKMSLFSYRHYYNSTYGRPILAVPPVVCPTHLGAILSLISATT